jgi:hypothetical protein
MLIADSAHAATRMASGLSVNTFVKAGREFES